MSPPGWISAVADYYVTENYVFIPGNVKKYVLGPWFIDFYSSTFQIHIQPEMGKVYCQQHRAVETMVTERDISISACGTSV